MLCRDLTSDEERAASPVNEPPELVRAVVEETPALAAEVLPAALANRHRIVKSPQAAFALPHVSAGPRVIATFRDLRLTVPSLIAHTTTSIEIDQDDYYWTRQPPITPPTALVERAATYAVQFYRNIVRYQGRLEVWSYGFWDGWTVRESDLGHLYDRVDETSEQVRDDVARGEIFSNASFSPELWERFCEERRVPRPSRDMVGSANNTVRDLFARRNLDVFTLDDVGGS